MVKTWESTEHYPVKFMALIVNKWRLQAANLRDMESVSPGGGGGEGGGEARISMVHSHQQDREHLTIPS